jgi:putative SOS response-associated peptidase YedK
MKSFRTTIRLGMVGLSFVESRKGNKEAKATLHVCAVVMVFAMKINPQGIRKASKTALVGAAEDGLGQRARFSKPFKELRMATFSARAETVETKPVFHNAFKRTRRLIPMPRWGSRLRRVREEMASRKRGGVDRRTPSPSGSDHYSRQPS